MYQKNDNYDYTFAFLAVTNINFVKYVSPEDPEKTVLPWFYFKFPQQNGPELTVSASETDVTASDQVCSIQHAIVFSNQSSFYLSST